MIFNGIEKDYLVPLTGRRRSAWTPISRNLITVTGMSGAHLSHTDVQVRVITVPVLVKAENISDLQKVKEDMADWLVHDEPKELIFKDEPDRAYYAVVDGELELDEIFSTGRGEITFICPDPYKYGPEQEKEFQGDTAVIENEGTAETYPIIEVELKEDTPFLAVSNGDDMNMIGNIPDAEEEVFERFENILTDTLNTTVGWTNINFTPYTGTITNGTIVADTDGFRPSDYGYQAGMAWHGPALAKSLSQPLQDFHMHYTAFQRATDLASFGRTELYALDSVNKPVASVHFIKDTYGNITRPEIYIYNIDGVPRRILSFKRDQVSEWKDLTGYLSIMREGQSFIAQAERSRGLFGGVIDRRVELFEDTQNEYQRPIVSVAVVFQAYRTFPTLNRNRAARVIVDKVNQEQGVPIVAKAGDIITFNHEIDLITKNEIDIRDDKAFIGNYFPLKSGENILVAEPADAIESLKVRWRERWR